MKLVYPAVITKEEDGYYVNFPDLPSTYTDGNTLAEALENAEDVLNLMLVSMEDDKVEIAAPSEMDAVDVSANGFVNMIKSDTIAYRRRVNNKAVRKNVSIPQWLDKAAAEHNLSLSNVLQTALMKELNYSS